MHQFSQISENRSCERRRLCKIRVHLWVQIHTGQNSTTGYKEFLQSYLPAGDRATRSRHWSVPSYNDRFDPIEFWDPSANLPRQPESDNQKEFSHVPASEHRNFRDHLRKRGNRPNSPNGYTAPRRRPPTPANAAHSRPSYSGLRRRQGVARRGKCSGKCGRELHP